VIRLLPASSYNCSSFPDKKYMFTSACRQGLDPTLPHGQVILGAHDVLIRQLGLVALCSTLSSAGFKNVLGCASTVTYIFLV